MKASALVSAACLFAALLSVGCEPAAPAKSAPTDSTSSAGVALFTDVSTPAGIRFQHQSGATGKFLFPEIMGGGGGFLDADGDGLLDIYLVQSGELYGDPAKRPSNQLLRNRGNGTFEDITQHAGVAGHGYGMGCAAGDVDNDGDIDLYLCNVGANILYRNEGGGVFKDITSEAGVGDESWSVSAAFVDYDADGDLDLVVANYVDWQNRPAFLEKKCFASTGAQDYCSPQSYAAPSISRLYRNDGGARFTDVTEAAGLAAKPGTALGVVCSDLNNDGHIDIYVSNDQMPSHLWLNRGDGTFREAGMQLGCAVDELGRSQAGMGVAAADIDDDGDLDLWKVHLHRETHVLYINGGGFFEDATSRWGLAAPTRRYTGFGTALFDYDHDGLLDIFVANGRVQFVNEPYPVDDIYAEQNQLLRQTARGRFDDVTASAGPALALIENSRAAGFGDYDNDGDIDVLVVNRDGPARLLRNDAPKLGGHVLLRVVDRHGRDAEGARLTCQIAGKTRTFEARAGYSYAATNDPRVHVGLGGGASIEQAVVRWPTGEQEVFGPLPGGSQHTLRQGSGRAVSGAGS